MYDRTLILPNRTEPTPNLKILPNHRTEPNPNPGEIKHLSFWVWIEHFGIEMRPNLAKYSSLEYDAWIWTVWKYCIFFKVVLIHLGPLYLWWLKLQKVLLTNTNAVVACWWGSLLMKSFFPLQIWKILSSVGKLHLNSKWHPNPTTPRVPDCFALFPTQILTKHLICSNASTFTFYCPHIVFRVN